MTAPALRTAPRIAKGRRTVEARNGGMIHLSNWPSGCSTVKAGNPEPGPERLPQSNGLTAYASGAAAREFAGTVTRI